MLAGQSFRNDNPLIHENCLVLLDLLVVFKDEQIIDLCMQSSCYIMGEFERRVVLSLL